MNNERRWWPPSPYDFVNVERCPACFTPLTRPLCPTCELDLADPQAAELLEIGKSIVAAEDNRQRVIARMRQTAALAAQQPTQAQHAPTAPDAAQHLVSTPIAPAVPVPTPATVPSLVGMPAEAPASAMTSTPPPSVPASPLTQAALSAEPDAGTSVSTVLPGPEIRKRRLTVPVLLIIVGVFLASVAAIGLAWYYSNLIVRALIIAGFTLATILAASTLRKRSLTMSAEGVAVLGVVLLSLDAWAVYATNLFGAGGVSPLVYAGWAIIVIGVLCRVWAVLSRLRAPDFAAVIAIPTGLGLLAASALGFDQMGALAAGFLGASAGTLVYPLPAPFSVARDEAITERTTLAGIGVGALAAGILTGFFALPSSPWAPLWLTAVVLLLAVAHLAALHRRDAVLMSHLLGAVAGVMATLAVATLGWQLAQRGDTHFFTLFLGPVIAVATLTALTHLHRRERFAAATRFALYTAAGIAGISLVIAFVTWLGRGFSPARGWRLWQTAPFAASEPTPGLTVVGAALAITVLLFLIPGGSFGWARMLRPLVIAPMLMAGAFASGMPGSIVIAAALIGACAIVLLGRESGFSAVAIAWLAVSAGSAAIAFFVGMTHPGLWLGGVALALALPVAFAWALRAKGTALAIFAVAPVAVAALACLFAPGALAVVLDRPSGGGLTAVLLLQWLAVLTLAAALLLLAVRTVLRAAGLALVGAGALPLLLALFGGYWFGGGESVLTLIDTPWLSALRAAATLGLLLMIALRIEASTKLRAAAAGLVASAAAGLGAVVTSLILPTPANTTLLTGAEWSLLREQHIGIVVAAVAALVGIGGMLHSRLAPSAVRIAGDVGALLVALPAAVTTAFEAQWASFLALTVLLGAMSVSRGWRNPLAVEHPGGAAASRAVPAPIAPPIPAGAPAPGAAAEPAPTPARPAPPSLRRLLVWAAFAAITWAWLSGVGEHTQNPTLEMYVLPVAVGLAIFCAVLVWLRRLPEASLAIVLAIASGLGILAVARWGETSPWPLIVIALIAAAIAIALHWSPTRRLWGVATAGATTALVTLVPAIVRLQLDGGLHSYWWVLLLAGAAYAAGLGATWREGGRVMFAQFAPPTALAAATLMVLPGIHRAPLLIATLLVLAAVHLASALLARAPFGLASRIVSGIAAVIVGVLCLVIGAMTPVEWPTLAAAGIGLAGVVAVLVRRARAGTATEEGQAIGSETAVWMSALVLAVLPSVIVSEHPLRTWLVIALAGGLAVAAGGVRHPLALPTALVLTGGTLLMGGRALLGGDELPALVAGGLALALPVVLTLRRADAARSTLITAMLGAVLAGVATVSLTGGLLAPSIIAVSGATVAGIAGALGLRGAPWHRLGAVVALAAGATVVGVVARRYLTAGTQSLAVETVVWPLVAAASIAAIAATALLVTTNPVVRSGAALALSVSAVLLALGELGALPIQHEDAARWAALLTVSLLTAGAVAGFAWRASLSSALFIVAAASAVLFSLIAFLGVGVRPVELLTAPIAVGLLVAGLTVLRRNPAARSWPSLGPGLAVLTIPSLLHDFGSTELWRTVALGLVGVALIVWGATRKLQAPLVLGALVTGVHGLAQLWPWIRALYSATEWWLWAGIAGVLLIVLAIRYEKQKVAMRKAFLAITSLR